MKLLYFKAGWCDPCHKMDPIIEEMFDQGFVKDQYSLEKVDVDENPERSSRMGIRAVPTFVILDKQGKERARHSGMWPKHQMIEWMGDTLYQGILTVSATEDACNIPIEEKSMLNSIKRALGLSSSDEVTGSVSSFAGPFVPYGFLDCDGRLLPVGNNYYTALFSVIGTIYGGDGMKTFALPDLRPTDKKGNKIDWTEAGVPRQVICYSGQYPRRS